MEHMAPPRREGWRWGFLLRKSQHWIQELVSVWFHSLKPGLPSIGHPMDHSPVHSPCKCTTHPLTNKSSHPKVAQVTKTNKGIGFASTWPCAGTSQAMCCSWHRMKRWPVWLCSSCSPRASDPASTMGISATYGASLPCRTSSRRSMWPQCASQQHRHSLQE